MFPFFAISVRHAWLHFSRRNAMVMLVKHIHPLRFLANKRLLSLALVALDTFPPLQEHLSGIRDSIAYFRLLWYCTYGLTHGRKCFPFMSKKLFDASVSLRSYRIKYVQPPEVKESSSWSIFHSSSLQIIFPIRILEVYINRDLVTVASCHAHFAKRCTPLQPILRNIRDHKLWKLLFIPKFCIILLP